MHPLDSGKTRATSQLLATQTLRHLVFGTSTKCISNIFHFSNQMYQFFFELFHAFGCHFQQPVVAHKRHAAQRYNAVGTRWNFITQDGVRSEPASECAIRTGQTNDDQIGVVLRRVVVVVDEVASVDSVAVNVKVLDADRIIGKVDKTVVSDLIEVGLKPCKIPFAQILLRSIVASGWHFGDVVEPTNQPTVIGQKCNLLVIEHHSEVCTLA